MKPLNKVIWVSRPLSRLSKDREFEPKGEKVGILGSHCLQSEKAPKFTKKQAKSMAKAKAIAIFLEKCLNQLYKAILSYFHFELTTAKN